MKVQLPESWVLLRNHSENAYRVGSILEAETGEAAGSQTMNGYGCHVEEFGHYPEDSGTTEGFFIGEEL